MALQAGHRALDLIWEVVGDANRWIDVLCPMAYTPELDVFTSQIASVRQLAGASPVWAGIGAYRLTPTRTIENIATARRLGASGVILFSYDSLNGGRQVPPDYLALVSRGAFNPAAAAGAGTR